MKRAFTLTEAMIVMAAILIVACVAFAIRQEVINRAKPGTVIERIHTPASYRTEYREGKPHTVHTPEGWKLVVLGDDGTTFSISVSLEEWAGNPIGHKRNEMKLENP